MPFDDNEVTADIDTTVTGSGNTNTNNSTNLAADLDNIGNTTTTVDGSFNTDATVTDSFKDNSGNTEWDFDDSLNEGSYNTTVTITDSSTHDNSVHAGEREYNLGFTGDVAVGGGGGDLWVNNQNTVVDQSASNNILAGHGVSQDFYQEAQVASGDGALAAGDDITIDQTLDASTTIDAGGDVLIDGSTKTVTKEIGSNNDTTVDISKVDNSVEMDLDNVGNTYDATLTINNSFNEENNDLSVNDWDVDASVIWNSEEPVVPDAPDVDVDY